MVKKREAKKEIRRLIEKFEREKAAGNIYDYNEEEAKKGFIEPLLDALGWNTRDRGEVSLEHRASGGRVDYALKIEGIPKIFVEAKPPKKELKDPKLIAQAINYGYNRGDISWVLLTDFEEFRLFDVTVKPTARNLERGLKLDLTYDQYLPRLDDVWLLSRESVEKGEIDRLLLTKPKERIQVNRAFLEDLKSWRERLAKDIYKHNPAISAELLREATQRLLDRIIFIRSCEDRKITVERQLRDLVSERRDDIGFGFMPVLNGIFDRYNRAFNSDLFSPNQELRKLKIDFKILKEIILQTYDPYLFDVLPVEILGNIYEQYLGYTIRLTDKRVKYQLKPEVRKAGGIYYTPEYVVDYIVKNTVGRLLSELKPKQVQKLRILDPACGSGSFLIRAYKELENYYQRLKIEKYEKRKKAREKVFRHQVTVPFFQEEELVDGYRLTIAEKRDIVLNHIFGVDIDEQAVEVTRLSLMLKMLEGEMGMVPGRAMLPMLDYNVQCGNSLISGDVLELKKFFGDDWPKIKPFDWDDRFKKIMDGGGFDVVVGNPPYVDIKRMNDADAAYCSANYEAAYRRFDIYVCFVERAITLLKNGAKMGFILPNKFMLLPYGKELRRLILENCRIDLIADLAGMRVFPGVAVENVIIVLSREKNRHLRDSNKLQVVRARETDGPRAVGFRAEHRLPQSVFWTTPDKTFRVGVRGATPALLSKIQVQGLTIGDICYVSYGAQTGVMKNFVFDTPISAKCKPFVKGENLQRYQLVYHDKFLLYDPKRLHRPAFPALFENEKIVVCQVSGTQGITATLDSKGYYSDVTTVLCIPKHDLENVDETILRRRGITVSEEERALSRAYGLRYVLAAMNSKAAGFYFSQYLTDRLHVHPNDVRRLPVPRIDFTNPKETRMHDDLVTLADVMLDLNKRAQKARGGKKALLQRQIRKTDREIDQLVYKLYGLTKEEIKVIESSE